MMTGKVAQLIKGKDDKSELDYCFYSIDLWTNWEEIQHQLWELYFKDLTSIGD